MRTNWCANGCCCGRFAGRPPKKAAGAACGGAGAANGLRSDLVAPDGGCCRARSCWTMQVSQRSKSAHVKHLYRTPRSGVWRQCLHVTPVCTTPPPHGKPRAGTITWKRRIFWSSLLQLLDSCSRAVAGRASRSEAVGLFDKGRRRKLAARKEPAYRATRSSGERRVRYPSQCTIPSFTWR